MNLIKISIICVVSSLATFVCLSLNSKQEVIDDFLFKKSSDLPLVLSGNIHALMWRGENAPRFRCILIVDVSIECNDFVFSFLPRKDMLECIDVGYGFGASKLEMIDELFSQGGWVTYDKKNNLFGYFDKNKKHLLLYYSGNQPQ